MSRIEAKRKEKKRRRRVKLALSLILLLFTGGLLVTDYSTREMLAEFDGQVFGYMRNDNIHSIYLFGNLYDINQDVVIETISNYINKAGIYFNKCSDWIYKLLYNVR
ncbi:hypothetical protein F8154_01245 [Alkaliphilus pronyensis]|uniref:Uncharacterized protein n=1 Tax=Alkaliphilus pronyensis TaxID=1482732 RepID=A0A6I0FIZ4_9FIRM|nr:hypothetical protein [Alkaliphilus pronyensis]KAB3539087.1 hypothetical protein F8154_01245 [Alkaliphilus pronyensis]